MTVTYATYSDFTAIYSLNGVSQSEISSSWLPKGALRLHEVLGGYFTTPFSANNYTAKDLNIKFAYLEILSRNRSNQIDLNIRDEVTKRIDDIRLRNSPMILTDGSAIFAKTTRVDAYSTTQNYNPTFTVLNQKEQRLDPDLVRDEYDNLDLFYICGD